MPDAELEAMGKVAEAIGGLEEEVRGRVIRWAAERYGIAFATSPDRSGNGDAARVHVDSADEVSDIADEADEGSDIGGESKTFEHFAELYDATNPVTDAEKVLVASYWTQVVKGKSTFGSRELNKELKDLGHSVGSISRAMAANMTKKPALILQTSRGGTSQQAQKKYKLSDAGKKWVEARLR
jgi:hypothetical protein